MIIAGDIGGTKTLLALFDQEDQKEIAYLESFTSQQHPSLANILEEFLKNCPPGLKGKQLTGACFAIAGPVKSGKFKLTNLPWEIDSSKLASICNLPEVYLINDLLANAYGIETLSADALFLLKDGVKNASGNKAIISPGTGLGEAGLFWDGKKHHPFASEGGHSDFSPKNELEIDLLRYLRARFDHVSFERVLSGPGLKNIYEYLRDEKKMEEPSWLAEQCQLKNFPSIISENAIQEKADICIQALNIFISIFGSEAGNVALKFLSTGGLYIGGGIPPKILPKIKEHTFLDALYDKGRMRSILQEMPIHVILDDKTALKGAAHYCCLNP